MKNILIHHDKVIQPSENNIYDFTRGTGLQCWYSADTVELDELGRVSRWPDKSGNNLHLIPGLFANSKPFYTANYHNNKPAVHFNSGQGMYNAYVSNFQPLFVVAVYAQNNSAWAALYDSNASGVPFWNAHFTNNIGLSAGNQTVWYPIWVPFTPLVLIGKYHFANSYIEIAGIRVAGGVGTNAQQGLRVGYLRLNSHFLNGHVMELLFTKHENIAFYYKSMFSQKYNLQ